MEKTDTLLSLLREFVSDGTIIRILDSDPHNFTCIRCEATTPVAGSEPLTHAAHCLWLRAKRVVEREADALSTGWKESGTGAIVKPERCDLSRRILRKREPPPSSPVEGGDAR